MNPISIFFVFMLMRDATAIVELDCSDNATCINHMAKEIIQSVRQQRTVRVFDVLTIEPLKSRQARMVKSRSIDSWLETFLDGNAFSLDWNDYTFKISQADDSNALDLEVYQGRTAKDVTDPDGKKSTTKNDIEKEEDKTPKIPGQRVGLRRRRKQKKVLQMFIPLLFGMKSAGVVMFAMAVVTVLTLKAFVASKLALLVTAGMAAKKLYESYGAGIGLQNHPYLYSQYPIDFPSASSHAYSVSGVSSQFASPEMYSPTGLGANPQANEIIHQSDASAQQSQQASTLLMNSTRAAERWDGKSLLLKLLQPAIDGLRNIIDPITNIFYGAMPATFRGLSSDVTTTKNNDSEDLEELNKEKSPRQILVPQPRNIAQRKMSHLKNRHRPKKHTELKISLDRLKNNKDLPDYVKTKKYKFNYPNTYFYPRVKYFVNPYNFVKRNNSGFASYNKESSETIDTTVAPFIMNDSDWRPITVSETISLEITTQKPKRKMRKKQHKKHQSRSRRSVDMDANLDKFQSRGLATSTGRYFLGFIDFFFQNDPLGGLISESTKYTKSQLNSSLKSEAPGYYTIAYNLVMMTLEFMDGLFEETSSIKLGKNQKHKKKKSKRNNVNIQYISNCTQIEQKVKSEGRGFQF